MSVWDCLGGERAIALVVPEADAAYRQPIAAALQYFVENLPRPRAPVPSGTYSLVNNTGGYFNNTYNYFGTGARIQPPIIRPGQYTAPPRTPGAPARGGNSPGFAPNPTFGR